jgi:hypothetical protein
MAAVDRTDQPIGVVAVAALRQSTIGGSGSFLVRADDDRRYWCKVLNNPQNSTRVPINEQIVGRLGKAIGVGVCEPVLVAIPDELADWEFRPGHRLQPGWAHGSLAVEGVVETHTLDHRSEDDNAQRHAGFIALNHWLTSGDGQWLVCGDEENKYYSHDHGHYFSAQSGPNWTKESLEAQVGAAAPDLPGGTDRLEGAELSRLADALEALTAEDIARELSKLPSDWPVSDEELEAMVVFADARREPTVSRLCTLIPEETQ